MKQAELTGLLCVAWAISLLYGEMLAYWVPSLGSCSWPHLNSPSTSTMGNVGDQNSYVKVAVLADPQLMDRTSHGLTPKSFALEMAQFYTDLFMRRAYLSSILPFKPDVVLFLGDYFDGGPYLSDEEWEDSSNRFKHIFDLKTQDKHTECPVYYIPGNHDVGYASLHSHKPEVLSWYEREFGKKNHRFTVGKVDFIAVDAQTLDGRQREGKASSSWDLVKNVSLGSHSNPRVLLTHIPLYRRDWTYCGPNRNSPVINQRIRRTTGNQEIAYQNYITEESSNYLLDLVKPHRSNCGWDNYKVLVLSGHDHDQCMVVHKAKFGNVVEHTVGTVSWQQGNLHPSFMLLSVTNVTMSTASDPQAAVLTQLCFLPMQTHIYIWYLLLFVATLLALLFWPTSSKSFWHQICGNIGHCVHLIRSNLSGGATKEKNEDENFVYEEIWDAEGTMHLIKKSLDGPTMRSSDKGPVVRGSAVIRPTAKMHNQDVEVSMNVDTNSDASSSVKLALKTNKSRTKIIVQRLVRTLWMLTIIAAVNVTLYMMLLFKDWNDM
ncbi:uncharacterized protein C630.12 isoform X2 [Rhodamnia argentea]|uniref:Uncharacterized protein C630.12 isoform X2 n=1 Tax=Rhodamnia argentea TaxID=178133 RepID=A0ABM3GW41_9MYRT|nr:uncharacterized protein C630.12 isoform X2 [Rhodamnia argentea]